MIAKETGFGLTRIEGEMRKLGIKISRQTVRSILKDHGIDRSRGSAARRLTRCVVPDRGRPTPARVP